MKTLLFKLMTVLGVGGYPIIHEFNPPFSINDNSVSEYFNYKFGWFPKELDEMYKWHNGQSFPVPVRDLYFIFDNAIFLPFDQAKIYSEAAVDYDSIFQDYFVLFTSGGGEDYLIKMKGNDRGSIWYCSPAKFLGEPVKAFDSLEKLVSSVIECYNSGVYMNEKGHFRIDFPKQMRRMAELNPGCPRWTPND